MIIISQSLVLSAPASVRLDTPLIGFRNMVTAANLAASSEDAAFPASNLANPSTALKWKAGSSAAQTLTISPADTGKINYAALGKHNLGTLQVPVLLEGRRAAGDGFTAIAELITAGDSPLLFRFPGQSFHELRFAFAAATAPVELAVIHAGDLTVLERGADAGFTPLNSGRVAEGFDGQSISGDYLGSVITRSHLESRFTARHVTEDFYYSRLEDFVRSGFGTAFFFAWSPARFPKHVAYAWLTNNPQPVWNITRRADIEFQMRGIAL